MATKANHRQAVSVPLRAGSTKQDLLFGNPHSSGDAASGALQFPARTAASPNLGQTVEFFGLTPQNGQGDLRLELIGVVPDKALIVRPLGGDAGTALTLGKPYDGRLFTGSRLYKFSTELISETAGPFGCVFLKYPDTLAHAPVRKHQRVATAFPGKLMSGEYQRPIAEVVVENISSTGAGVAADENLLMVGQNARLFMYLTIDCKIRPVTVFVEVRNRRQDGDKFRYGLEFVRVPDEVRREIKDFVLDRLGAM